MLELPRRRPRLVPLVVSPAVVLAASALFAGSGCSSILGDFNVVSDTGGPDASVDGNGSVHDGALGDGHVNPPGEGGTKHVGDPCTPADTCVGSQCVDGYCCTSACTDVCGACNVPGKLGTCSPVMRAPVGSRACNGATTGACAGTCDGISTTQCQYSTGACGGTPSCSAGVGTAAGTCSTGVCNQPMKACADKLCGATACATVAQVATGADFACALLSDTTVRCWGNNNYGQLGTGDTRAHLTPTPVKGLTGVTWLGTGDEHACAIVAGGAVVCWGANYSHQLGLGDSNTAIDNNAYPTPAPVCATGTGASCVQLKGASKVVGGGDNTCAIVGTGVQCWGNDNGYGQLGIGPTTANTAGANPPATANPVAVCAPTTCSGPIGQFNGGIVDIAMGGFHVCALDGNNLLYCWGNNGAGETGPNNNNGQNNFPQGITGVGIGNQVPIKLALSQYGSCAIISDGTEANNLARCWGYGATGERGNSTSGSSAYGPTPVTVCSAVGCGTNLTGVTAIASGAASPNASTNCAVANGAVYCWGGNEGGTAGTNIAGMLTVATANLVTQGAYALGGEEFGNMCALLNAGGTLRCWGVNQVGQIGNGLTSPLATPAPPTAQSW
jgi:alpha-tubulin suppressor-like RCC1 family protein